MKKFGVDLSANLVTLRSEKAALDAPEPDPTAPVPELDTPKENDRTWILSLNLSSGDSPSNLPFPENSRNISPAAIIQSPFRFPKIGDVLEISSRPRPKP